MPGLDAEDIRQSPLWNHMVKVLSHIVSERPADPLEAMGPTSHYILSGDALPGKTATKLFAEIRPAAQADVPADALVNTRWAANMTRSLAPPAAPRRPHNGEQGDEEDDGYGALDDPEQNPAAAPSAAQQQLAQSEAEGLQGATISDVVSEQMAFNAVGVGLPQEEAFRVVVGLKQLVKTEPLASVRLWGKILGSHADYYIAETTIDPNRLPEGEDGEDGEGGEFDEAEEDGLPVSRVAAVLSANRAKKRHSTPKEEANTGLNEHVYFAAGATDPTVWTRLPDVTPEQVMVARLIRCGFTGDLERPVYSHPRFPGVERHYLRAQIARITCTCHVAPKDVYTTEGALPDEEEDDDGNPIPPPAMVPAYAAVPPLLPQETPDEEDTEAIQPVQAWFHGYIHEELLQGKHWVHIAPTLLANGRVTVAPPHEPTPEEEEEEQMNNAAGEEPQDEDNEDGRFNREELINPFLSDLSKDTPLSFPGHSRRSFPAWTFRQAFHNESSGSSTYLARSTLWPGAFTYAVTTRGTPGAQSQMVYIGNGLKNLQGTVYAPQLPPKRMVEYPEDGLVLQRDCTVDEELSYAPAPTRAEEADEEDDVGDEGDY